MFSSLGRKVYKEFSEREEDTVPATNADVTKSSHTGGARSPRSRRQGLHLTGWGTYLVKDGPINPTPGVPYLSIPCL